MQAGSRPMYRDDIFYGASASRLSSQMSTRVTATLSPTTTDALDEESADGASRSRCRRYWAQCYFCPHAVRSTLAALLDHSIITNTVFLMFAVTHVFFMMGFFTPYLFSQGAQATVPTMSRVEPPGGSSTQVHLHPGLKILQLVTAVVG